MENINYMENAMEKWRDQIDRENKIDRGEIAAIDCAISTTSLTPAIVSHLSGKDEHKSWSYGDLCLAPCPSMDE